MRTLLAITIVVLALALLGWITFSADDGGATIRVDTNEAKQDIDDAARTTGNAVEGAVDRVREKSTDE